MATKTGIDLRAATQEIKELQALETGVVFEIGRILSEVRDTEIPQGRWLRWLEDVGFNTRTSQRYIQIYERLKDIEGADELSVSKLTELLSIPVDVDASTIKEYVTKAKRMTARSLRQEIKQRFTSGGAATSSDEQTKERSDNRPSNEREVQLEARIRVLERQVREIAKERDAYKEEKEIAERRAEAADATRWFMSGNGYSPHDLLGVDEGMSTTEARKRYRNLANIVHPDKGGDAKLFDLLRKAYDSIK